MRKAADYLERYQELGQTESPDTTLGMVLLNAHTHTQILEKAIGTLQMRLHELASGIDGIVRDAGPDCRGEGESAINVAQRIQHTVIWTLANLGLDNITGYAADATQGQAKVAELEGL